jgi:predicted nuclease of predicted toxin-antitoxin system
MRFIVDAQVPPALARWLMARGYEATHVASLGLQSASDSAIWERAIAIDAVIVTKDEDFAQRKIFAIDGPRVIWVRLPNTRNADLLAYFQEVLPDLLVSLINGETLIELVK